MAEVDEDEQFYRDTESVAFPKLDDRQLALLEPLGTRRIVRRGELVFQSGPARSAAGGGLARRTRGLRGA